MTPGSSCSSSGSSPEVRAEYSPYNHRSVSKAFARACEELKIDDLHFHDLRHEGSSRLFEAGLPIEKVALVTGHKDWRTLRRYAKLKPEELHKLQTAPQPSLEEFIEALDLGAKVPHVATVPISNANFSD